jgi:glycosyltransferase involved in cell wall biosynthesis
MQQDFLRQYNSKASFLLVPPTIVAHGFTAAEASDPRDAFSLGFLSNLSMAKGLDDVIETFEQLAAQNRRVRLILAGPCAGEKERRLVDQACERWPDRVDYRGPVFGAAKAQFFADIDAFLFPTRNESWGIVLCESLAAKRPVIARSRGCVPWIVHGDCGLVVEPSGDFVTAAVEQVSRWIDDPERHRLARVAAHQRSRELEIDAERQLPQFVEAILALGEPNA